MTQVITVPNSFLGSTFFRMQHNWKALSTTQKVAILGTSIFLTAAAVTGFLNATAITGEIVSGITSACTVIHTFCASLNLATVATTFKYVAIGLGLLGLSLFTIAFFKKPDVQKKFDNLVREKATQLVLADLLTGVKNKTEQVKNRTQEILERGKEVLRDGVKNSVEVLSQTAAQAKEGLANLTSRS